MFAVRVAVRVGCAGWGWWVLVGASAVCGVRRGDAGLARRPPEWVAFSRRGRVRTGYVGVCGVYGAHSAAHGHIRGCLTVSIRRTRLPIDDFVQIDNTWMRDSRLSRKARGLLAELLTHSVGWEITIESLVRGGPEGREAIRGAIRELEKAGYLERKRRRQANGTLSGTDYELRDPGTVPPTSEKPTLAEPSTKKNNYSEDQLPEHHDPKTTSAGSRRAMSGAQLSFLMDLVMLLDHDETDPEGHVRRMVTSYDEADGMIQDLWQQIEHAGRDDLSYDARRNPEVYRRLSPRGRAFVDQEDLTG